VDKGTLGAISTVLVTVAFIVVCWWAFSPRRKKRFDDAANLPFADETKSDEQSRPDEKQAGAEQQRKPHSGDAADRRN